MSEPAAAPKTSDRTERALSKVRDALSAVNQVPAAAIDENKHERICDVDETLRALESELQNELDQQLDQDGVVTVSGTDVESCDAMRCRSECDEAHTDWTAGEKSRVAPESRGWVMPVECDRCGYIVEVTGL